MKAQISIVVSVFVCLLVVGTAGAVLPSGNGRTTMAKSVSVVIASDQAAIPVSGTISVDTSALATAAKQDTGNTSLATIATNTGKTSSSTDTGQNLSLGDTASHAFGSSAAATIGVLVSAPLGNTAAIYCALASGVTSGNTGKGVELQPGDRERFPVANANLIYCITGTATQNVHAVAF